ncbi:hypothetical protein KP12_220 [Klebsiella phage KP12]|uniref:Uncharacterized protein n=1 Tax=Klebsiella phage KP12 TaxID=2923374 RepID=A0A9E7CNB4_9CAUD|nr:hypothetical protein KP12_220 [Klebsiella phage KP12]
MSEKMALVYAFTASLVLVRSAVLSAESSLSYMITLFFMIKWIYH